MCFYAEYMIMYVLWVLVYETVLVLFMLIRLNKKMVHKIFFWEVCAEKSLDYRDIILYMQHVQQVQNSSLPSVSILLKYIFIANHLMLCRLWPSLTIEKVKYFSSIASYFLPLFQSIELGFQAVHYYYITVVLCSSLGFALHHPFWNLVSAATCCHPYW